MSVNVHSSAMVDPSAQLADGVKVDAYAIIGPQVSLGEGTWVGSYAVIQANTRLGARCRVYPHAAVGFDPQDLKFKGEISWFESGDDCVFREFCTMHRGTGENGRTVVGSRNLFMAYTHVAHDCLLGSDIIMSNNASASGHCVIEDHVIMGGFSALHQNVRVGEYAMVGGAAVITKDVCPYVVISGDIAKLFGLNLVGLRRAGFSRPDFQALEEAYKILFRGTLNTTQALDAIAALPELNPHVKHLLEFARASQRGIHK